MVFSYEQDERGTKQTSEYPTIIKSITSWTPGGCSIHWAMRAHGKQGHLTEFIQ